MIPITVPYTSALHCNEKGKTNVTYLFGLARSGYENSVSVQTDDAGHVGTAIWCLCPCGLLRKSNERGLSLLDLFNLHMIQMLSYSHHPRVCKLQPHLKSRIKVRIKLKFLKGEKQKMCI